MDLPFGDLLHAVVIVHAGVKAVSSSEAHIRVTSSPKFDGRPERAEARLNDLMEALSGHKWRRAFDLCWDEFVDMHELFETSAEPFRYRTPKSEAVVEACRNIWNHKNDGPLVTMDAGPNVHLLFKPSSRELADKLVDHFRGSHMVLSSWRGWK